MNSSITSSLLSRAQQQDDAAWEKVNHLFQPLIYGWICKAGVSSVDADDISQQVLHQIFRNIGSFKRERPSDTFTGWVWTTTKFKIRDHLIKLQGDPQAAVGGSVAHELLNQLAEQEDEDFDSESSTVELTRRLLNLIRSEFRQKTWDAFWRVAVEGENPNEVATEMEMTVQAVYKAKSRVMRRVREELDGIVDADINVEN